MRLNALLYGQPKILWVLMLGELWSTFSYFGTQTVLVLYFLHVFHLGRSDSYLLYGTYAVFAYSLPILGGIVSDKWLGNKNSVMVGSFFNIVGNLILMTSSYHLFCLGLSVSLIGFGLYKSSATALVGFLYQDCSMKKESGFTLFYLASNVGGVLGPLLYGLIIYVLNWHFVFLCSATGVFVAFAWLISCQHLLKCTQQVNSIHVIKKFLIICGLLGASLLLSLPFYVSWMSHAFVFVIITVGIIYLVIAIAKYKNRDRCRLLALVIMSFFAMFYFAAGLQIGTTITLFIQASIHQGFVKTSLPASVFSTLYPLFVLVLAPFFAYLWSQLKEKDIIVTAPSRLAMGILLAAAGISIFAIAAVTHFIWTGVVLGNLMLGAGELALTPAIYTAISNLSPVGMKSTMMGCWLLCIALGGYLSSVLAEGAHAVMGIMNFNQAGYTSQFSFIAGVTFMIALLFMFFIPSLSKMIK